MWAEPAGAVYGTISVGVLLAAESALQETYLATVASVVITLLMYVLAHAYAGYAGHRLESGEPLRLAEFRRSVASEAWLLGGAAPSLIALVIFWVLGASLDAAVTAGVWTSARWWSSSSSSPAYGLRNRDASWRRRPRWGALLGALVIVLRLVLH